MMKKGLIFVTAMALTAMALFTGCGGGETESTTAATTTTAAATTTTTAAPSGSLSPAEIEKALQNMLQVNAQSWATLTAEEKEVLTASYNGILQGSGINVTVTSAEIEADLKANPGKTLEQLTQEAIAAGIQSALE